MGTNGVVPNQPINQFLVEGINVVSQEGSIRHNEILRECPIKPFDVSIHLWRTRIAVEMDETERKTCFLKELGEFRTIVRLQFVHRERANINEFAKKIGGTC